MTKNELTKQFKKLGEDWLKGSDLEEWSFGGKTYSLLLKQKEFVNERGKTFICASGGLASGKSLALLVKVLMLSMFFPNNSILLGRRYLADLLKSTLTELLDLVPYSYYVFNKKDNIITFFNGSKILLFSLDSLTEGSQEDKKKALASIRGLNLGCFAIEELHQISYSVFNALCSRLRRSEVPIRQGLATTNPSSFWGFEFFKLNKEKRKDIQLIEMSMLDNPYIPKSYIEQQVAHDENYIRRFVKGEWSLDLLLKNNVFDTEHINFLSAMVKPPFKVLEGVKIWENPLPAQDYYIGVDTGEGKIDESAIAVVSSSGELVADFHDKIPIPQLIDKVRFTYDYFSKGGSKPLIVPETSGIGMALLMGISDLRIYHREVFDRDTWGKQESDYLGFKTSAQSKEALISNFKDLLRKNQVKIYDLDVLEQMKTFVYRENKQPTAEKGYHDDLLMAVFLGFFKVVIKPKKTPAQLELEKVALRAEMERIRRGQNFI